MKRFFPCLAILSLLLLVSCTQHSDFMNDIRVDGEMRTVFESGSNGHTQMGRMRTGISF